MGREVKGWAEKRLLVLENGSNFGFSSILTLSSSMVVLSSAFSVVCSFKLMSWSVTSTFALKRASLVSASSDLSNSNSSDMANLSIKSVVNNFKLLGE